jgi:hypothetical protein
VTVDGYARADNFEIGGKEPLPASVTKNDDGMGVGANSFFGEKGAAQRGADAEKIEIIF